MPIAGNDDVVRVRQLVRTAAASAGFSLVDQTKIVTAASELARNTLVHGGGGSVGIDQTVSDRGKHGLRIVFTDQGPGIPDMEQALVEGWSSGNGLGLGLSGTRRLVDEFSLESEPGEGTTVTVVKWIR
ncbi:anti-sigma regulatory factor [Actinomadura sp. 7K534]|nr:anti-sigma regulatory factor [Actinomadura sp. 7K534]